MKQNSKRVTRKQAQMDQMNENENETKTDIQEEEADGSIKAGVRSGQAGRAAAAAAAVKHGYHNGR